MKQLFQLRSSSIRKSLIGILLLLLLLWPLHYLYNYYPLDSSKQYFNNLFGDNSNKNNGNSQAVVNLNKSPIILFPTTFKENQNEQHNFTNKEIIRYQGNSSAISYDQLSYNTTKHPITLLRADSKSKYCSKIKQERDLIISDNFIFNEDFKYMVEKLLYQLNHDRAFVELSGFFQGKIPGWLAKDEYKPHFYKFAGTSVWLKEYGIHLMVSRVLFSRKGIKWSPQISLLYAQIFDINWQELKDIELVIPMMDHDGTRHNEAIKFPKYLPIAYYYDHNQVRRRWYGPEDTRIMLVQNEIGKEEPIIIFNSHHRSIKNVTQPEGKDDQTIINFQFHRSMFIGWPFRYQLGKVNTDGASNEKFDNIRYNKVAELKIWNEKRKWIEKNWTPFIDPLERVNGEDKFIYLVYQWDVLQVLKCEISDFKIGDISRCDFIYKEDKKVPKKVGPIRGGTEILPLTTINPNLQNYWMGILRAHINHCGCGRSMYRPNFFILKREGDNFKVLYLSSSISFNIPVSGWRNHHLLCAEKDPNVLIPNGISNWEIDSKTKKDILTLTLSVADENNSLIHIYGLKQMVEELIEKYDVEKGDHNELMSCVLKYSKEFCKEFGEEQTRLGTTEAIFKKKEKLKSKADPKKEEPKKEEPNKEEPNKEEPNKEEPNKEEPNKEEPNKEEPKKEEPKKEG
ncbi:unnamed protein product [Candida verbasci]|uniref:Beta-mannosyltransferase 1 n=1 Tax=Candida verbasci TaxID=1227364 RepID=A0A9W4XCG4_9ASCO|nr:unnamed protein product [Candida verbasci]